MQASRWKSRSCFEKFYRRCLLPVQCEMSHVAEPQVAKCGEQRQAIWENGSTHLLWENGGSHFLIFYHPLAKSYAPIVVMPIDWLIQIYFIPSYSSGYEGCMEWC